MRPTVWWLRSCPNSPSASARFRVLLHVQSSGDIGIAAGGRIEEPLEVPDQGPIGRRERVTATSGPANPRAIRSIGVRFGVTGLEFGDAATDRRARQLGGRGDERDATSPQGEGLSKPPSIAAPSRAATGPGLHTSRRTRGNHCRICHNDSIETIHVLEQLGPVKK